MERKLHVHVSSINSLTRSHVDLIHSVEARRFRVSSVRDDVQRRLRLLLLPKLQMREICSPPVIKPKDEQSFRDIPEHVSDLSYSPDGLLLVVCRGSSICLYDPIRNQIVKSCSCKASVTTVKFVSDQKFTCGDSSGYIRVYDTRKCDEPLNTFQGHSQSINNILYCEPRQWLISSDITGEVMYWHLPSLEAKSITVDSNIHYGALFSCPGLNKMSLTSDNSSLALCSRNSGAIYSIENIDWNTIQQDVRPFRFDENLQMHLAMLPTVFHKRNKVRMLREEEFSPAINGRISSFSQLEYIADSTILLSRLTTKKPMLIASETKDWTVCIRVADINLDGIQTLRSIGSSGSICMKDILLYKSEELRFAPLREKTVSISSCKRLIASPSKQGVRLLSFSRQLSDLNSIIHDKINPLNLMDHLWLKPSEDLITMSVLDGTGALPLCCTFSPKHLQLVAGDTAGNITFYQPQF